MRSAIAAGLVSMLIAGSAQSGPAPDAVVARTRAFLDAYARQDEAAVVAAVEPEVTIYGSDAAEVFHGVAGVRRMMRGDARLWRGAARIGEMRDVAVVSAGPLSVITFQAPFQLGSNAPVLVRFSLVWKREAAGWRLAQSANSVPTRGQSAEALLKTAP